MSSYLRSFESVNEFQKRMQRVVERHRDTSDSIVRIDTMLEDIAVYYEADRVLVIETDWCFGCGKNTFEYHSPFVNQLCINCRTWNSST